MFMNSSKIDILCIQETHLRGAEYYELEGFLVALSGGSPDISGRSHAGVGFIVSPHVTRSVISFSAIDDRVAALKIKVPGGTLTLMSAYAPHSGHTFETREAFFSTVTTSVKEPTRHSSTLILGDFNAKLGRVMGGEEEMVGKFVFKSDVAQDGIATSNRSLLVSCAYPRTSQLQTPTSM